MKINSNIPALQASRHLNKTNDKIQKSLQKLSSGYKINDVSDDPTGTAVSGKIKAQLYGLKLASRNALDGVSLVQTAEGAMSEVQEMLGRIRELCVQSANDTNAPEDRNKIQMEIDELLDSIDQMADVTEFNQMKLLNGSLSNLTTITEKNTVSGAYEKSYDLSVRYMSQNFPVGDYGFEIVSEFAPATLTAEFMTGEGTIKLNGDTVEITAADSKEDIQTKILDLAGRYNCSVTFDDTNNEFTLTSKEAGSKVKLELSGSSIDLTATAGEPLKSEGVDAVVALSGDFSLSAVAKVEGNRVIINERGGEQIQIDIGDITAKGEYNIKIEDKGQLKLQIGANEEQRIALMIPGLSTYALGLRKQAFDVSNGELTVNLVNAKNTKGAERSIELLDDAVSKVSAMRATLGAYQNRLEHTVKSLDINSVNTEESLSRVQDTDMALEMSKYTLNNVILQSAISMLSQANERPQQLLQLLR